MKKTNPIAQWPGVAMLPAILALLLLLITNPAWPDSYRCGSKLIRTGDTSGRVLKVCGQPTHKDRGRQEVRIKGQAKDVSVERWYYRKGSQRLGRIVMLHRGKVVAIETQGR